MQTYPSPYYSVTIPITSLVIQAMLICLLVRRQKRRRDIRPRSARYTKSSILQTVESNFTHESRSGKEIKGEKNTTLHACIQILTYQIKSVPSTKGRQGVKKNPGQPHFVVAENAVLQSDYVTSHSEFPRGRSRAERVCCGTYRRGPVIVCIRTCREVGGGGKPQLLSNATAARRCLGMPCGFSHTCGLHSILN